jgi:hypothetical protein
MVPVNSLAQLVNEVDWLTIRHKYDDLCVLVAVQEHQKVDQAVLSGYFEVKLADLSWNGKLVFVFHVNILVIITEAYSLVGAHEFGT